MTAQNKMLSQNTAENIRSMITIEKRFAPGDRLPNEQDLADELHVSRTTLREAVKILAAYRVLEIRRGIGTFVTEEALNETQDFEQLADVKTNAKDLYEMRKPPPLPPCAELRRRSDGSWRLGNISKRKFSQTGTGLTMNTHSTAQLPRPHTMNL